MRREVFCSQEVLSLFKFFCVCVFCFVEESEPYRDSLGPNYKLRPTHHLWSGRVSKSPRLSFLRSVPREGTSTEYQFPFVSEGRSQVGGPRQFHWFAFEPLFRVYVSCSVFDGDPDVDVVGSVVSGRWTLRTSHRSGFTLHDVLYVGSRASESCSFYNL